MTKFEDFLQSEGIHHQHTIPKTPEQNGVSERLNRTLMETVHSMLIDAKLPHKFCAEALSIAVYLRNQSSTKAVKSMTPFEAWARKKPKVGHLRVFGCDAYAHIPKDERHKLDSKIGNAYSWAMVKKPKHVGSMILRGRKSYTVGMFNLMKKRKKLNRIQLNKI